jgi:hypothetical protein
MALSTIGSIATHIAESFPSMATGISGNLVETVNMSRVHVQNYTGDTIGSNAIAEQYQSAILNFSKADVVDLTYTAFAVTAGSASAVISTGSGGSYESLKLAELSISEGTGGGEIAAMNSLNGLSKQASAQFRQAAENSLKYLGRGIQVGKVLV